MRLPPVATCALALLVWAAPAWAQVDPVGDWTGTLQSPAGPLTLIVSITRNDDGTLRGELESPDQAPGQKIPLTSITVSNGHLSFTIAPIKASYDGDWVEEAQQWSGTFMQGIAVPLTLRGGQPPAGAAIQGLDGRWEGTVARNGVDLRLVLRVTTTPERGTVATFDAPDQLAYGLPVDDLSRTDDAVSFRVPASSARFDGRLAAADALRGVWSLPGQGEVEVAFERTSASIAREARPRPQTPTPPFPYRAEEVRVDSPRAGITLAGTLTLPEGDGPFPAAVLITGSGAQDRDETLLGHKPFAVLADYLTRRGIAVLRYDDRGVGGSTGAFAAATSADFATDAAAVVSYLRTRGEIRSDAIGLVGHSEGGMVAPITAAGNGEVAFVVSLAGPGTGLVQLLQSQRRLVGLSQGMSEAELAKTEPVMADVFAAVAASSSAEDAQRRVRAVLTPAALQTLGVPESGREAVVQQVSTEWFRYFLRYDPAPVLARLRVPVLAINGTLDRQVPADENLAAIETALAGNPDVTIRRLDGLNHLFQTAKTGAVGEYAQITETMSPVALAVVADWIAARFGR